MSSTLATYVEEIARKRAAMVSEIVEVPASPPHGDNEPNEDRIAQYKQRVKEIYNITNGNPSNGQWAMMSRLLRLGVTSGKHQHWIGTRTDLKAPEEHKELQWINADSEQEWVQWEKRASMVDKVKNWNRQVEVSTSVVEPVDPLSATSSQPPKSQEPPPKVPISLASTPVDPLDTPTPLGFSVVKRTNKTAVKGKPSGLTASQKSARKGSMGPPPSSNAKPSSESNKINQLPEPSLPAPSFSTSQIITSTPKPVPGATTAKPRSRQSNPLQDSFILATPSLPRLTTPPPPAASDSNPKAAPLHNSQSLPAIPLPPTPIRPKQTFSTSNTLNANNKRILELEEVQAQKKARTVHSPRIVASTLPKTPEVQVAQTSGSQQPEPSPSPRFIACPTNPLFADPVPEPPTTPTKTSKALPTLTELLASGRKNKDGRKSTRLTPKAAPALATKPSSKGKEKEFVPDTNSFNNYDENAAKDQGTYPSIPPGQILDSLPAPVVIDEENPYMLDPNALRDQPAPDDIDLLLTTKAVDLSPTKSLSSIADSDEEDEDDIPNSPPPDSSPIVGTFSFNPSGFSFNPQATSTQNQYGPFSALNGSPGAAGNQSLSFLGGSFPFRSSQGSTSSKGPAPSSSARYAYRFNKPSESQNNNNNNLPANSLDSWASVYKHRSFQYNSQLQSNIAKQVDQVDKLLEKDVDYEGWLKDPSPEPEEREGAAAPGVEDSP